MPRQFPHFNSKMVRLKAAPVVVINTELRKFQFQNGTIKRTSPHLGHSKSVLFQFQNGTIKRDNLTCPLEFTLYFNSKMVRLKDEHSS